MSHDKPWYIPDESAGIDTTSLDPDGQSFLIDPKDILEVETTDAVIASFSRKVKYIRSKTYNATEAYPHFATDPILSLVKDEEDTKGRPVKITRNGQSVDLEVLEPWTKADKRRMEKEAKNQEELKNLKILIRDWENLSDTEKERIEREIRQELDTKDEVFQKTFWLWIDERKANKRKSENKPAQDKACIDRSTVRGIESGEPLSRVSEERKKADLRPTKNTPTSIRRKDIDDMTLAKYILFSIVGVGISIGSVIQMIQKRETSDIDKSGAIVAVENGAQNITKSRHVVPESDPTVQYLKKLEEKYKDNPTELVKIMAIKVHKDHIEFSGSGLKLQREHEGVVISPPIGEKQGAISHAYYTWNVAMRKYGNRIPSKEDWEKMVNDMPESSAEVLKIILADPHVHELNSLTSYLRGISKEDWFWTRSKYSPNEAISMRIMGSKAAFLPQKVDKNDLHVRLLVD